MTLGSTLRHAAMAVGVWACILGRFAAGEQETLDRIAAVVNDDIVLESELEARLDAVMARVNEPDRSNMMLRDSLRGQVLEQLILESIQLQEAALRSIEVDDEELTRAVANFAGQNNLTVEAFIEELERRGDSYGEFREQVRRDLTLDRVQRSAVNRRVYVSSQDIDELLASPFFQEMISDEYRLGHILLQISPGMSSGARAALREKADEIVAQLREGADFSGLAVAHSSAPTALEGGDLGWRKTSRIPGLFAEEVVKVDVGEVVGPLEDASGLHIVKVIDKSGASDQRAEQTLVRHILLAASAIRGDDETRAAIEDLRERIVAGEDFAELAKEFSEDPGSRLAGGDLGWTTPENLDPAFQRVMNFTGVDELSQAFQTSFGWHILEVQGRRQQDISEEARRNYALQILHQRRYDVRLQEWLSEIRDEAFVEDRLGIQNTDTGAAPIGG